jgi:NCS1 family nucleobase:cation symporter-1
LATVSLGIIWQISFSPYVSDYSRYLPADIGSVHSSPPTWARPWARSSFSFRRGGGPGNPEGTEAMAAVKQSTGWLGPILMVLFLLNIISHNALNLYGAVLSIITSIQTFASQWTPSIKVRVVLSVVLAGCCVVALGASADFISQFIGLILALLLVLVPWASINLIDFYVIKRGCYDIASIFRADGGVYGRFNLHAIVAYFIGIIVQLPFANTSLYVGPPIWLRARICRGWWGWW